MCLSLQSRLRIAQTYAALIEQETGRPLPGLEDCQRIAALFGKTLSAPEGELPEQIEKLMRQFVSQQAPLLFPFFAQFPFVHLLEEYDASQFCTFRRIWSAPIAEKPLMPQFSAPAILQIFREGFAKPRTFLFQALMEIKRRTAFLPLDLQRQCLTTFLFTV